MDAIQLLQRLHQHRIWVNTNLLKVISPLTEQQLTRPFEIGQGSIWRSIVHLYAAEFVWLAALEGNENPLIQGDVPGRLPGNQLGENKIDGLNELVHKWLLLDARWLAYLAQLKPDNLEELVYKISTSSGLGIRFGSHRSDILLHVCTHAQYTVAQINNMLRQTGLASMPETMLISMARQESPDR